MIAEAGKKEKGGKKKACDRSKFTALSDVDEVIVFPFQYTVEEQSRRRKLVRLFTVGEGGT